MVHVVKYTGCTINLFNLRNEWETRSLGRSKIAIFNPSCLAFCDWRGSSDVGKNENSELGEWKVPVTHAPSDGTSLHPIHTLWFSLLCSPFSFLLPRQSRKERPLVYMYSFGIAATAHGTCSKIGTLAGILCFKSCLSVGLFILNCLMVFLLTSSVSSTVPCAKLLDYLNNCWRFFGKLFVDEQNNGV